jgi:hypothetical protein
VVKRHFATEIGGEMQLNLLAIDSYNADTFNSDPL